MTSLRTPETPLNVFVYGRPQDPLQAEVIGGLKESMQVRGAVFQDEPDKQTKLIIVPAQLGKDIPLLKLPYHTLGKRIDRYQAKIVSFATTPHIPTDVSEIELGHLAKVLDMRTALNVLGIRIELGYLATALDILKGHRDREELVRLANGRGLSAVVAMGYPQIPHVGCSYSLVVEGDQNSRSPRTAYLIGLEQSHPQIGTTGTFYEDLAVKFESQARDQLIIANHTRRDVVLPRAIYERSIRPEAIIAAGKKMKEWNMYPPGFPFQNFTSPDKVLYYNRFLQVTGLSYGNISMRASDEEAEFGGFWMSKSGAKKDRLLPTEVYLVTGLIEGKNVMGRAQIEGTKQDGRVSVDAIELQKIFQKYLKVGATAHGHEGLINPKTGRPFTWFPGYEEVEGTFVVCTDEQHLCGSIELGEVTVASIARSPDPAKTIVLQRRHGFQALGQDFDELFGRLGSLRHLLTLEIPQD